MTPSPIVPKGPAPRPNDPKHTISLKSFPGTGVKFVCTQDRSQVGVKFSDDARPTDEEKELVRNKGFEFWASPRRAHLRPASIENHDKAEELANQLHHGRES